MKRGSPVTDTGKSTYEEKLAELTAIVDEIGNEECPVDSLEDRVTRAAELIRDLRGRLASTEMTVRNVLEGIEKEDSGD
jgi:exodeoxyribonuclease VII small subunit